MKDLEKNVTLLCPLCGNDQFECLNPEWEDDPEAPNDIEFRCSDCDSVYTKQTLINENSEKIELEIDEMIKNTVQDVEKELEKAMKKWKI